MLRDFEYNPKTTQLIDVLQSFGFDVTIEAFHLAVLKFEVITPDSFMWRLLINDNVYYLYAEDYIPNLDHVKRVFDSYLESDEWVFVDPVNTFDGVVKHAIKSGYDSVFLVKSADDADDAQFSGSAPRGFTQ